VDDLLDYFTMSNSKVTRNDIVLAAVKVFLDVAEILLLPDCAYRAHVAAAKLLGLLPYLPIDEFQAIRLKLFEA
jgi:hypothetical protein